MPILYEGSSPRAIETISLDPFGRTLLRAKVLVRDEMGNEVGGVAVDASIWSPVGGPYQCTRLSKVSGWATFPWGASSAGAWKLCVEGMSKDGYVYDPVSNEVPNCASWSN